MGWDQIADLTGPAGADGSDGSDADVTAHEAAGDPHPQYAEDSLAVHLAGAETITGAKAFSTAPTLPIPSLNQHPIRNDDSRLTNARTPTAHNHAAGDVNSATLDIARIPTGSTGSTVPFGNDARFSDSRAPNGSAGGQLGGTYPNPTLNYGTSSTTACAGNDSRLSDSRAPNGSAGGVLTGSYPNPGLDLVPWAPVALTDASTVTVDASLGNHFRLTLTATGHTMGAPSNPTDGQRILFEITSGGVFTFAWFTGTGGYVWGTDVTVPTLSQTSTKVDYVGFIYHATANKWRGLAVARGY